MTRRAAQLKYPLLPRRALEGSVDVDDELKRAQLVQRCCSVALGASWCAALPPVRWRGGIVNQTSDLLKVRTPASGPAELPQLTGRLVILVQSGIHLFGVAISAVTIQRGADALDQFMQAYAWYVIG